MPEQHIKLHERLLSWDGKKPIDIAVMVDVDGTLAGVYEGDVRPVRENVAKALEILSKLAPVILWSMGGEDNCMRLLREHPELIPQVSYIGHKIGFPLELIKHPFCIDDQEADEIVLQCDRVIVDTYYGGKDSGQFLEATRIVAKAVEELLNRNTIL